MLVIYTVLVGPKEPLNNPLADLPKGTSTDLDIDFVCITDDPALHSDVWRFVPLATRHLPPEKLSRRPKALPHDYFPDASHSLYLDNTVRLRRLPQAADLHTERPYLLRAFRHPSRTTMLDEADAVAALGYDDVDTLCRQIDFYASLAALDSLTPLTAGTVLLRSHHHETVRRFGQLWWETLLAFSKRDQLALDFAVRQSGAEIDYLPGATHDNDLLHWQGSMGPKRVKANFDAPLYAWRHRQDPAAQADPRAHFLAHDESHDRYQRRVPLLEYVCHRQHSSLGRHVAPRRGMAGALEDLLLPHRRRGGCRYLMVLVQGSRTPCAFAADELASAQRAISMVMGQGAVGSSIEVQAAELAGSAMAYGAQNLAFDLIVVLGAEGEHLAATTQRFVRLLAPERGSLVLALASPVALEEALRARALIGSHAAAPVRAALQGSRHDDLDGGLDHTVVGFSYGPA
ncbi:conserved hypothetical protein [Rubrivivax sp. A210]|uniref:glycosyltransferase domain-containing protein n=1 Tax=Rubrivivax sp. A210 TaxID=2772301 RepID=UPI00191ADEA0|nr:glycosyltransferase domain-containing protein [Rubrivivax sp. A210]CAD5372462.1 conserved hypothetical protein [Rubrivivax sp. A210]